MIARKTLEWLLLAFALLVLGSFFYFVYDIEAQRRRIDEANRLQALSAVIASNIETDLGATSDALESVIRNELRAPVKRRDPRLVGRLDALDKAMPGVRAITVIDNEGSIIISNWPELRNEDVIQRTFFESIKLKSDVNTLYVAPPFRLLSGGWVIAVARAVHLADGSFGGLIVATIDSEYFTAKFRAASYAPDVWAFVAHGDGTLLLNYPSRTGLDGHNFDTANSLFRQHRERGGMAGVIDGDIAATGEQRLMAIRTIQAPMLHMSTPIVIGLSRQQVAIMAPIRRQAYIYALFLAVLTFAGALSVYVGQRRRVFIQRIEEDQREQLHALQVIGDSERRFRTLIEDAPLAIAILRHGHFIYTNPRYRALHGFSNDDDLTGLPWRTVIAADALSALRDHESLIEADSEQELHFEALGLGHAGRVLPLYKHVTRVALADGNATLIFAQDISAQKRAETDMLLARDAAEAANRSKAEFLANMSHEIRSPLNAILGLAYLLQRTQLDPDARGMVGRIRLAGQSLLGIINDILDVSKIEAGHMSIEQVAFSLGDVIDTVANAMSVGVGDKDVELLIQALPANIDRVIGDPLRLQQVLVNLTSNAVKFTANGQIKVSIALQSRQGDEALIGFSVLDTGIGIDPAAHEQIFSPFTQADNSTTRRFGGTGLGLTICRRLVGLMGGELILSSAIGRGSEFSFSLPVRLSCDEKAACIKLNGIKILVIDDHAAARDTVATLARGLGCTVDTAGTGALALARLRDSPILARPDVVLLDWSMPQEDVLATAKALRTALVEQARAIVVMSTTHALAELADRHVADTADGILNKPVTASNLQTAVTDAMRRRATIMGVPDAPGETGAHDLDGIRILVVDDSDINRDVAEGILTSHGASTKLAVDGQAALDWLAAHPGQIDIVLMDVQMPIMDGIEATRRLHLMPGLAELPVVALTAGAFKMQQEMALSAGMSHFISKPFDIPTTIALIQQLVRYSDQCTVPPSIGTLPTQDAEAPIDLHQAMQLWNGMERYRHYLGRFVEVYGQAHLALAALANQGAVDDAAALAHKLVGASGNLALPSIYRLALEAEHLLSNGMDAQLPLSGLAIQIPLALQAIATLASTEVIEPDLRTDITLA